VRLVLWDIDGTLVDSGGLGPDAFPLAFERTVGRPPAELAAMSGRTDQEIALETLERNGIEEPERLWPEFARALAEALAEFEPAMRERGRALPGARDAIAALAEVDGIVQSLLTGNVKPNAAVKLSAFDLLLPELDLEIGAYGSDHRHRPALVSIARQRAGARHGHEPPPEQTVLIGDTPLDVAAGRAGGVRVVGVATGRYGAEALAEAGAHAVLGDLLDTDAVVDAVLASAEETAPA
jgi:phosphoglycolate phosphatase